MIPYGIVSDVHSCATRACRTYRNVTQDRQQDVDEKVGIATTLEEYTQRREDNGENDLDDIASFCVSFMLNKKPVGAPPRNGQDLPCCERHGEGVMGFCRFLNLIA